MDVLWGKGGLGLLAGLGGLDLGVGDALAVDGVFQD